ncbi:hypothetical protein [Escherichia phage vB_EcoP-720R6]|nr:hypothetical protein [Escherichia phage vB_EcoP-720R6]
MIRLNNYRSAQSLVCLIGYETIILHGYFTTSAQYDIVHNLKTLIIYPLPRLMPVASNGLFCKLYFYYLILILCHQKAFKFLYLISLTSMFFANVLTSLCEQFIFLTPTKHLVPPFY